MLGLPGDHIERATSLLIGSCYIKCTDLLVMMDLFRGVLLLSVVAASQVYGANLTSLVDLFIGTSTAANGGSGGNAFPGMYHSLLPNPSTLLNCLL